jgi:hypothetical protein
MAGIMLQTLESHSASNFHFLWTGDKSWLFSEYRHERVWAASWEKVDEIEPPTHCHRRVMNAGFLIVQGGIS